MRLVDVHCHLESEDFASNLPDVIADARKIGIIKLITAAVTVDQWERSESIAKQFPEVEFALGVHPWYVSPSDELAVQNLRAARDRGAKAIGEIGLDAKIQTPPMDLQIRVFEAQLTIAKELDLPVVLHCRGAFNEMLQTLKRLDPPRPGGVLHAFSGSIEVAEEFMKLGLSFSMGQSLTYRNSRKREQVLKRIYPERFLLETDSPDMTPVEMRGTVNVPANMVYNLRAAAELLGEPEDHIAEHTTRNASRLFHLDI